MTIALAILCGWMYVVGGTLCLFLLKDGRWRMRLPAALLWPISAPLGLWFGRKYGRVLGR